VFRERLQVQGGREARTETTSEHRRSGPRERHTIADLRVRALKECRESFRVKDGNTVNVRFVGQSDREALKNYVRSMSERCRYNRFLSASSELPEAELDRFTCLGEDDRFTLVATTAITDLETIVGEASYAVHSNVVGVECSLSVSDRWQELGIGMALLKSVEYRAASVGAECIFGDVLPSNKFMIRLARKRGYAAVTSPVDLRLVRCVKTIRALHHDGSP
jgi:acetyltransferase